MRMSNLAYLVDMLCHLNELNTSLQAWVSERFFSRGGKVDFSWRRQKYFSSGGKSDKISFHPLKTKKTTFFAKNLIGKCQVSNSREGQGPPAPTSNTLQEFCINIIALRNKTDIYNRKFVLLAVADRDLVGLNTKGCLRQSLCVTQKRLSFVGQKWLFCWSNYPMFQGITTVWKRFISLIQKTFETGPKQWALFFTGYADLVYLQKCI